MVDRRSPRAVMALLALALLVLPGCGGDTDEPPAPAGPLRIGVLPDQSPEALRAQYQPLVDHLAATTGREVHLEIPASYAELVDHFAQGRYDLAWFGGLTFIRAEARSGAVPLVLRDVDLDFTSDYLVAAGDPAGGIGELGGRSFAFGPELSTSGHLMPRYFLEEQGIDPEGFFGSVRHSGAHDQTARWVQEGVVEAGVANSVVVAAMIADGRLDRSRVRILARTPSYRDYVWAVPADLGEGTRTRVRDAFLALDPAQPGHAAVLEPLGAGGFLPASRNHFLELREAAGRFESLLPSTSP